VHPSFPKERPKTCRSLDSGQVGWFWWFERVPSGWDDVRHGCTSVPWMACVIGLEGSGLALASISFNFFLFS